MTLASLFWACAYACTGEYYNIMRTYTIICLTCTCARLDTIVCIIHLQVLFSLSKSCIRICDITLKCLDIGVKKHNAQTTEGPPPPGVLRGKRKQRRTKCISKYFWDDPVHRQDIASLFSKQSFFSNQNSKLLASTLKNHFPTPAQREVWLVRNSKTTRCMCELSSGGCRFEL